MMNTVKKRASPITIWFDGSSCVPSACRRKWKTITTRVKQVIVTSAAGTNVSSVRRTTIWSGAETPADAVERQAQVGRPVRGARVIERGRLRHRGPGAAQDHGEDHHPHGRGNDAPAPHAPLPSVETGNASPGTASVRSRVSANAGSPAAPWESG